jgi:hypothetical protein
MRTYLCRLARIKPSAGLVARYVPDVSSRSRIASYGSMAALVVAGTLCGILVPGVVGEALVIVLLSVGFGGAVLLVFLEVGLSEEREREREEERRRREARRPAQRPRRPTWWVRRPRR